MIPILYVDDEFLNLKTFELLLRKKYHIITANNALDALKIVQEQNIQVIVSDQRMPYMRGVEFLSRVKNIFPNSLCIIHSAYLEDIEIQDALKNKLIDYSLEKPLDPITFNAIIAKHF
jgi:response regulator RpfG family c-di-GMP phosphodiesterase